MKIELSPQRREDTLTLHKHGHLLHVNGELFDFSPMTDGATLPRAAISSEWFTGDVELQNGELSLTLLFPIPENHSQAQAFPEPLLDVPDGLVELPTPLQQEPDDAAAPSAVRLPISRSNARGLSAGSNIDWGRMITKEQKAAAAAAQRLALATHEIARLRAIADYQILPLQDAVDLEQASAAEMGALKAWKKYRVALSRVDEQSGFPDTVTWPEMPTDAASTVLQPSFVFPGIPFLSHWL